MLLHRAQRVDRVRVGRVRLLQHRPCPVPGQRHVQSHVLVRVLLVDAGYDDHCGPAAAHHRRRVRLHHRRLHARRVHLRNHRRKGLSTTTL